MSSDGEDRDSPRGSGEAEVVGVRAQTTRGEKKSTGAPARVGPDPFERRGDVVGCTMDKGTDVEVDFETAFLLDKESMW